MHSAGRKYSFFVAFEPEALIAAYWAGFTKTCKYYYHSLELYEPDSFKNRLKRRLEKKALSRALFVVAQDEARINNLRKGFNNAPFDYLVSPVSMMGPAIEKKGDYLYRKYNIPLNKKIIVYTGAITSVNYAQEMAYITNSPAWNSDWILVIHGFSIDDVIPSDIRKNTSPEKVILSLNNLSQADLDELVSSAEIGIALYKKNDDNNSLIILSSGKIAQYAKCGLPIIVTSNSPTDAFLNKYNCGRSIIDSSQLCDAIRKIFAEHDTFRNNMLKAFVLKYEFMNNYKQISDSLLK